MGAISERNPLPVAAALALVAIVSALGAAEPPSAPILSIETSSHIARVSRVAADPAGRYIVTASVDKTARVWDSVTGQLLQTLRPPQGANEDGQLYALAISPDAEWIATGGLTGDQGDYNIYIFQRAGGRLVKRIGGLAGRIASLAWSRNSRYLVAALSSGQVHLLKSDDFSLVGEDRDCRNPIPGIDIDSAGRLASVCHDGFVRLYRIETQGVRLTAKKVLPGGKRPYSIKFSPDGSKLAIGYVEFRSPRLDVLDATTLEWLFSPDTRDLSGYVLYSFAWSSDGNILYAAGGSCPSGVCRIRRWEGAGRGAFTDLIAGRLAQIDSMALLPQGGIVYGGFNGAWGVLNASNQNVRLASPQIAEYSRDLQFAVSQDGSEVRFSYELEGNAPARFSVTEQTLTIAGSSTDLTSFRTTAPGLAITDLESYQPKLNGRALQLEPGEAALAAAIAPDAQSFLLGTQRYVRAFEHDGRTRWTVRAPGGGTVGVNVSGDGKYALAELADGTIRWYRYTDGHELLALFPHADRKRWVMWTPRGYYSASPAADNLIGWHVNRGRDQAADFYPSSRFRAQFYRPDVIEKVLPSGDEAAALRRANAEAGKKEQTVRVEQILPPVVDILSPASGETAITSPIIVKFSVRTPADAPVTAVRVRVNGQVVALPDARNLAVAGAGGKQELSIPIPPQDSEIMIFAENKNGISTPGLVRLAWHGATPTRQDEFSVRPKLYVLAVGVSEYQSRDLRLGFAAKDARDFVAALMRQKGLLYRDVEVKLLTDAAATRDDVVDGLEWIRKQVTNKDVGIVFLAGHGENDPDGKYYFLPVNADPDKLKRTGVVFSEIRDTLAALPGKAVFFIDTCHAGNVLGTGRRAANIDITGVVNELASAENGVLVFSSSTGRQYSMESPTWRNGAFTKAVVEGLSGRADYNKNGRITHKMLDLYISERVKELTDNKQTPVTLVPQGVPDFPVALMK